MSEKSIITKYYIFEDTTVYRESETIKNIYNWLYYYYLFL